MTPLLAVFLTIIILFFILLAVKEMTKKKFCVICASISLSWAAYLMLNKLGYFHDKIMIGVLMGQTAAGIYYLVERKVKEELHIFRLPLLLSLTLAAYFLISPTKEILLAVLILIALWIAFLATYSLKNYPGFNKLVKKIIACCKNW